VCVALRVKFLLKTDGGYPRDAGVFFHSRWQTLGVVLLCVCVCVCVCCFVFIKPILGNRYGPGVIP